MSLQRFAAYVGLLLFALLAFLSTGYDRELDFRAYSYLQHKDAADVQLANDLVFVDLGLKHSEASAVDCHFRTRLADVMQILAAEPSSRPRAVVVDAWMSVGCQGRGGLMGSIERFENVGIPVYFAFNPQAGDSFDDARDEHDGQILGIVDGWGHTVMSFRGETLFYEVEHAVPRRAEGSEQILALPIKVSLELDWATNLPADDRVVVPLGIDEEIEKVRWTFTDGALKPPVSQQSAIHQSVVVIGDSEKDDKRRTKGAPRVGPELILWALNERKDKETSPITPLNDPLTKVVVILVFLLVTLALYALSYRYIKRAQAQPVLLAVLCVVVGLVFLLLFFTILASLSLSLPVGMPAFSVLVAAVVCGVEGRRQWLLGTVEGIEEFDVFISYSRSASKWVIQHLYEPLQEARLSDGRPLAIYFDQTDGAWGKSFTGRYMNAIVNSRYFVPVFSEDYYQKNHCRNELELAVTRHVEGLLQLLPITLSEAFVPDEYKHLDYLLVDEEADLIAAIVAALE